MSTIIETDLNMAGLHHFGSTTSEPVVSAIMAPRTYRHSPNRRRQQRGERSSDASPQNPSRDEESGHLSLRRSWLKHHFFYILLFFWFRILHALGSVGRGFRQMGMRWQLFRSHEWPRGHQLQHALMLRHHLAPPIITTLLRSYHTMAGRMGGDEEGRCLAEGASRDWLGRPAADIAVRRAHPVLLGRFWASPLVQKHTDGPVLADPVRHLVRVDPQGQFAGEEWAQGNRVQATARPCRRHQRIHLAVDSDAPVARALEWPFREPMVVVMISHYHRQRVPENHQVLFTQAAWAANPEQAHDEVGRRKYFCLHDWVFLDQELKIVCHCQYQCQLNVGTKITNKIQN